MGLFCTIHRSNSNIGLSTGAITVLQLCGNKHQRRLNRTTNNLFKMLAEKANGATFVRCMLTPQCLKMSPEFWKSFDLYFGRVLRLSCGSESSAGVAKASVHTPQAGSLSCSVSWTPSGLHTLLAFTTIGEGEEPFNGFKNESPDINLSTVIRRNSFFRTVVVRISVQAGGSARSRSQGKLSKCSSRTLKDGDIWTFQEIRTNHKWVLAEPTADATEIFFSINVVIYCAAEMQLAFLVTAISDVCLGVSVKQLDKWPCQTTCCWAGSSALSNVLVPDYLLSGFRGAWADESVD